MTILALILARIGLILGLLAIGGLFWVCRSFDSTGSEIDQDRGLSGPEGHNP